MRGRLELNDAFTDTFSNQRPFLPFGEFLIENHLRQEE